MTINVSPKQLWFYVQSIMIVAILVLLVWSQPWNQAAGGSSTTRKITVSGSATIEAEPDEYTFSPYFQENGSDKEKLKTSLTAKANAAVERLKELGVADKDIKVDASAYDYWYYVKDQENPMTVSLTVKVDNKELAQKIQDYLLSTDATGQLTPYAVFSEEKQKELDKQAVEKATEEAKTKAEAQAKQLGTKLGKVVEVAQGDDYGYPIALDSKVEAVSGSAERSASLPVMPGENEYRQSVTITYELK
jgi:uncharacterized protein